MRRGRRRTRSSTRAVRGTGRRKRSGSSCSGTTTRAPTSRTRTRRATQRWGRSCRKTSARRPGATLSETRRRCRRRCRSRTSATEAPSSGPTSPPRTPPRRTPSGRPTAASPASTSSGWPASRRRTTSSARQSGRSPQGSETAVGGSLGSCWASPPEAPSAGLPRPRRRVLRTVLHAYPVLCEHSAVRTCDLWTSRLDLFHATDTNHQK
mmetsp:Transcript_24110/g.77398  ORF Transcript_24110/g.77398 Transcript_24110/m.77398 type:complete len:209 (-) Transcript_24110:65-691(-)